MTLKEISPFTAVSFKIYIKVLLRDFPLSIYSMSLEKKYSK